MCQYGGFGMAQFYDVIENERIAVNFERLYLIYKSYLR